MASSGNDKLKSPLPSSCRATILVAYCKENRVIGVNNSLPWPQLKDDLPRFKTMTTDQCVIMGRKTWESLPVNKDGSCWLLRRENFVISRNLQLHEYHNQRDSPLRFFDCLEDAVAHCQWLGKQVYIIGGEQIYKEAFKLDLVDEIIASEVYCDYKGDAHFPKLTKSWKRKLLSGHDEYDLVLYLKS